MVEQNRHTHARGGAIINMSSVNAVMAIPSIAGYNASKGGVNNLTRCALPHAVDLTAGTLCKEEIRMEQLAMRYSCSPARRPLLADWKREGQQPEIEVLQLSARCPYQLGHALLAGAWRCRWRRTTSA